MSVLSSTRVAVTFLFVKLVVEYFTFAVGVTTGAFVLSSNKLIIDIDANIP